jgi:predicted deacylase
LTYAHKRLGKNLGGYFGETIDINAVLADCVSAARSHGWVIQNLSATPTLNLLALTRSQPSLRTPDAPLRIYISAGIHGDEPAGPLAVRQLLAENTWPANVDLWLCPCLNPAGFALNRRTNAEGLDLNRQYRDPAARETIAHIAWLKQQPDFDSCLCLHEDWESQGFYLFEANPDERPSYAKTILNRVSQVCPIDSSEVIEGWAANNGIIRPNADRFKRPDWPEALFLIANKSRLSCTLEAPSDFPLSTRVAALVAGVRAALEARSQTPTES